MVFALSLVVLGWVGPPEPAPAPKPSTLTTAQAVRQLPRALADGVLVDLQGVVTYSNPATGNFFLQDSTAGVYIHGRGQRLQQGEQVRVVGRSARGGFAPQVNSVQVAVVGKAPFPLPLPFALTLDESRWLDGQWVTVWAVVQSAALQHDNTAVGVQARGVPATVQIPGDHLAEASGWIGKAVRLTGVCVPTFDGKGAVNGPPRVFVQNPGRVRVFDERPADADRPRTVGELTRFVPDPHPARRLVTVRGIVGGHPFSSLVFVQDGSAGLRVELKPGRAPPLPLGTRVDVAGRLDIRGKEAVLYDATVQSQSVDRAPDPLGVPLHEIRAGRWPGVRVRTEGTVQEAIVTGVTLRLTLRGDRFAAVIVVLPFHSDATDVPVGSRVQVIGCPSNLGPNGVGLAFPELIVDGLADVAVLERPAVPSPPPEPSWWTPERVTAIGCALTAVVLIGLCWVVVLRRTVRLRTEEVQAAFEKQAELQEQLRQSQKLEAVGQLAGGIAHDFNNLLTVVNGCSELLAADLPADSPSAELVADIRRAGDRAAALTGQLLLFSRRKRITPTAVDLNATLADSVRLLGRLIPAHIRVSAVYAPDLPPIRAEAELIHQIVLNLALNSRDAMPNGGALTLTTIETAGGGAGLHVVDTGCGMDAATQKRLFEPFFTTKEVGQGTGLGLATVYGIVQAVGGRVRFRSAIGKGTTFEIDFELAGAETKERQVVATRPSSPPPARGVVLLVEDDEGVRMLARRVLEAGGYQVLVAADPEAGEKLATEHPGTIDLLLTDVVMPNMNGGELAERVRRARPGVKVVFMSGYTPDEVARQGVGADPHTFLSKPFTPPQMLDKLRVALNR